MTIRQRVFGLSVSLAVVAIAVAMLMAQSQKQIAHDTCAAISSTAVANAPAQVMRCVAAIDAIHETPPQPSPGPSPSPSPTPTPTPTPTPIPPPSGGLTYNVRKSNTGGCQSPTSMAQANSCMVSGDTLILGDGTWNEAVPALPNGSDAGWTRLIAEHDGAALITGACCTSSGQHHLAFDGLRVEAGAEKKILGNHLAFKRTGFKGGCASGNCTNTTIGTNDSNDTADILLEDDWFYGAGGRYNLLVYNAQRVITRRVVVRHDGGWMDTKGDPEAGLTFYNCTNCVAENSIVIDSNLSYHSWQSAFYGVYNSSSPGASKDNQWLGILALNNTSGPDGAGLRYDGNGLQSGLVVTDAVFWAANWGLNLAYQGTVQVTATRLTIGRAQAGMTGIGGSSPGAKTLSNVRLANASVQNVQPTMVAQGAPQYLPRQLNGVGASIEQRIGVDGTLYGQPGWDTTTVAPLWPWPLQDRLKLEMCAGVTRGFCGTAGTLTDYIWGFAGNPSPIH